MTSFYQTMLICEKKHLEKEMKLKSIMNNNANECAG